MNLFNAPVRKGIGDQLADAWNFAAKARGSVQDLAAGAAAAPVGLTQTPPAPTQFVTPSVADDAVDPAGAGDMLTSLRNAWRGATGTTAAAPAAAPVGLPGMIPPSLSDDADTVVPPGGPTDAFSQLRDAWNAARGGPTAAAAAAPVAAPGQIAATTSDDAAAPGGIRQWTPDDFGNFFKKLTG